MYSNQASFNLRHFLTLLPLLSFVTAITTTVLVGQNNQLIYSPSTITGTVGDIIEFEWPTAIPHSVVQGSSMGGCSALQGGFDSGVLSNASTPPTWEYTLTAADAAAGMIYFYCSVGDHCAEGMYGMIEVSAAVGAAASASMPMPTSSSSTVVAVAAMQTAMDTAGAVTTSSTADAAGDDGMAMSSTTIAADMAAMSTTTAMDMAAMSSATAMDMAAMSTSAAAAASSSMDMSMMASMSTSTTSAMGAGYSGAVGRVGAGLGSGLGAAAGVAMFLL